MQTHPHLRAMGEREKEYHPTTGTATEAITVPAAWQYAIANRTFTLPGETGRRAKGVSSLVPLIIRNLSSNIHHL